MKVGYAPGMKVFCDVCHASMREATSALTCETASFVIRCLRGEYSADNELYLEDIYLCDAHAAELLDKLQKGIQVSKTKARANNAEE